MQARGDMGKARSTATFLSLLALSSPAAAQTIGTQLQQIVSEVWNPLFLLVAVGTALLGIFLFFRGMMKLVEAAQSGGGRAGFGPGITHIVIAAFLIALPDAAGIGMMSIFGSARGGGALGSGGLDYNDGGMGGDFLSAITGGLANVGAVDNCLVSAGPATCMAKNLATNVVPMAVMMLFAMVFIVGLIAFASAIIDIAKASERGDNSKGHVTRIVTSILLMNAPLFFTMLTTTLLNPGDSPITATGFNAGSSMLSYPTGSNLKVVQNFTELIGHSFTILTFFGAWAFLRGIFMVKSVAEKGGGQGSGSYGMAATYVVAGILLANAKFSACLVLGTIGGSDMGAGFCN